MAKGIKFNIKLEGIEELQKNLKLFTEEAKRELENATDQAASEAAGVVRNNAPSGPRGNLAAAVETKKLPTLPDKPATTMVGLNYRKAPHQHLVEFGSGPRYHKGTGKYIGQMPASGFFRKSIDSTKARTTTILNDAVQGLIDKTKN